MAKLPHYMLDLSYLKAQDACFEVHPRLAMMFEPEVVWAAQHEETNAYITVRKCGDTMLVDWRGWSEYSLAPFGSEYFRADTIEQSLAEAVAYAREQLKLGPPPAAMVDQKRYRTHKAEAGRKGGEAKAANKTIAVKPDDPLYFGIDPALHKWIHWEEEGIEIEYPVHDEKKWQWKGAPHKGSMLEHLKITGCCIIVEPTLNPDPADFEAGIVRWDLLRDFYPAADENNQKVTAEFILNKTTYRDCVVSMAKLAKSDPSLWRRGDAVEIIRSYY